MWRRGEHLSAIEIVGSVRDKSSTMTRENDYLQEIKPRSSTTVLGVLFVLPCVVLLSGGVVSLWHEAWHFQPRAPQYPGDVPFSRRDVIEGLVVCSLVAYFMWHVLLRLLSALVLGRSRPLLPTLFMFVAVGLLGIVSLWGGLTGLFTGDLQQTLRGVIGLTWAGGLLVPLRMLRARKAQGKL